MATKLPNENLPKQPATGNLNSMNNNMDIQSSNPTSTTTGVKLENIKTEPGVDLLGIKTEPLDGGSGAGSMLSNIKTEDIKKETPIKQEPLDIKPSINSTNR